jgi:hypothetical protein
MMPLAPSSGEQVTARNRRHTTGRCLLYMLRVRDANNDRRDGGCRVTVKMTLGIHSDVPMFCGAPVAPLWLRCGTRVAQHTAD